METELAAYIEHLEQLHENIRDVLLGLSAEGLNWTPLAEDTHSLFQLAQHSAWNELWWIGTKLADRPFPYPWEGNEDLEGLGEDAADLLFWLDEAAATTNHVLGTLEPMALEEQRTISSDKGEEQRSVRWIILHVIEHYAEHIGQMCLLRQLWEATERGAG
jgi:uncharacterized damage-inducible protein DinB